MTKAEAIAFRRKIEQASAWTDDADALEMVELFPMWRFPKDYIVGERIQYNSLLYKCVQAHTSQESWTPDTTPALWVIVSVEEFPEWRQPQGSADAYMMGDKVTHLEKRWISDIDNNVWEPSVYGWREYTGDTTEETTEIVDDAVEEENQPTEPIEENQEEIKEWTRPEGNVGVYMINDKVIFDEQIYTSIIDNNVWSPAEYPQGWELNS